VRGPFGFHRRMDGILDELVQALRSAGAEVIDPIKIPTLGKVSSVQGDILSYEFKDGLNRYLSEPGRVTPIKSLAEAIAFNDARGAEELRYFGQEDFIAAQVRGPLTDPAYLQARSTALRLARAEGIDAVMNGERLDALVMMTKGQATLIDPLNGEGSSGGRSTLAAMAGYPSITVPAAQVFGLPVGLSFVGRAWSETKLLRLAADFETRTRARRAPRFLPSAEIP
jgi:amidase